MKFLVLAALVAVATAAPGLVQPGPAGPAPAPNPEDSFVPIAIGPAIIDSFEPIAIGPAIVDKPVPAVSSSPLVQIIINVNSATSAIDGAPVRPEPVAPIVRPEPIGEIPAEPVQIVDVAPEPVQIDVPILPLPVILPEELN